MMIRNMLYAAQEFGSVCLEGSLVWGLSHVPYPIWLRTGFKRRRCCGRKYGGWLLGGRNSHRQSRYDAREHLCRYS